MPPHERPSPDSSQWLAVIGAALAIVPLIALVLFLQRFWRLDLIAGGVKG